MEPAPPAGSYHTDEDEKILHKLGYAQELFRAMGGFQNFAISFTIISILAGCLTSYYIAFGQGGPVAVSWGWLLVGGMSIIVSLAMAEIASAFPTAGGLYYWASKLGSPAWGWFTGWFNLIGQIAVTAAIGYGLATFGTALLNFWFEYPNTKEYIYLLYVIFLALALAVNLMKVSFTAFLNTISAYWHIAGVIFIVIVLLFVPDNHQSLGYVFGETVNASGFGDATMNFSSPIFWYVFATGLLMAQYTITGFDASAHMAEETTQASRMLFAFSRDGAVPGHRLWRQVGKNRVPQLSCAAIAVLSAAVMIPAIWNYLVGYLVGTGIAVIGLYVAFILPVILRFRLGDKFEHGAWSLGKHYKWIDAIAIIWVAFISILFLLPPYKASIPGTEGWTWEAVNYAPILVGGALLLFGGWWVISANKWFKGPVRMGSEEELEQLEQRLEDSSGMHPEPAA